MTVDDYLARLRADGWMVAVHNDYREDGMLKTFWLFTHANGRWVKGEGPAADERGVLAVILHEAGEILSRPGVGSCKACSIEADIGTEENPHPVPRQHHTCKRLLAREERLKAVGFTEERPPDSVGALIGLKPGKSVVVEEPEEPCACSKATGRRDPNPALVHHTPNHCSIAAGKPEGGWVQCNTCWKMVPVPTPAPAEPEPPKSVVEPEAITLGPVLKHFAVYGASTKAQIGCVFETTLAEAEAAVHAEEPEATVQEVAEADCPTCKEFEGEDDV